MGQPIVASILVGSGVLLIALGFNVRRLARDWSQRLHHFVGRIHDPYEEEDEESLPGTWREAIATRLNRFLARRNYVKAARLDLVRAGMRIKPTQFFLVRVALAFVGVLVGSALLGSAGSAARLVGMLGGFGVGYLAVRPYIGFKQRKRRDAFDQSFADALDIMVGGLESGSSLTAAVELVSREMPAPLSTEFARVLRDASLGMSYEDAFNGLYLRMPTDDVGMLVSAIGIQFRVGGNLANVLRTLGETVRDRQRIRGDIKTLTAQQKMTGWLITLIPFFMVGALLMINRSYMARVFQPGPQRLIAAVGAVMILIGNYFVRRILRIEV